jgi:hypothetical protein
MTLYTVQRCRRNYKSAQVRVSVGAHCGAAGACLHDCYVSYHVALPFPSTQPSTIVPALHLRFQHVHPPFPSQTLLHLPRWVEEI